MMKYLLYLALGIFMLGIASSGIAADEKLKDVPTKVVLETSMGNITLQLNDDMPITIGNFKSL
ncbi:MAG: hypothetical protein NTW84_04145, partial [Methanothrix sp.]|nr:hypothetical protein [Methanothrix sp.]